MKITLKKISEGSYGKIFIDKNDDIKKITKFCDEENVIFSNINELLFFNFFKKIINENNKNIEDEKKNIFIIMMLLN